MVGDLTTTTLVPYFGSNRMLAEHVGVELRGCSWVGVIFAGGMSELAHIPARSLVVNDLHRHVINLARVAQHPELGPKLYRLLRREAFHPDTLKEAQARCLAIDSIQPKPGAASSLFGEVAADVSDAPSLGWARNYFVSQWMGRSGKAGTDGEFKGKLPVRWNANGGDSAVRYQSAVASLVAWRRILRRCNFTTLDCFEFLDTCKDEDGHGIYADPPFPGPGDAYCHNFTEKQQRQLADRLAAFTSARVVIRYYHDHPLIRELYPSPRWTWIERVGRKQTNEDAPEVLILNGASRAAKGAT
jgi:hypothetical protein